MARVNVYLPDELLGRAREAGLNLSGVTQAAVARELRVQETNQWLARLDARPRADVSHDDVLAAIDAARDEFGA